MKIKLTVTIEKELIPQAKQVARSKGISLSRLIEDALRESTEIERPPFSERWRGKFQPAKRDDERYRHLERKYL